MDEPCSIQALSFSCIKKTRRPKSSRKKSLTLRGHLTRCDPFFPCGVCEREKEPSGSPPGICFLVSWVVQDSKQRKPRKRRQFTASGGSFWLIQRSSTSIWRTSETFNGTVWNENKMHSFQKNIIFLWGINYNGGIDSKKGAGYGKSWKTTGRG